MCKWILENAFLFQDSLRYVLMKTPSSANTDEGLGFSFTYNI